MKILVTGGSGFLGSHLCDRLINLNHDVICLDNFSTGSKSNIAHHLDNPKFKLVQHDVVDKFDNIEVEQIYNLACPASPVHYQKDPIKTVKTSVIGAINALNLAKSFKARILQASTSEVYGDPQVHPQTEDYRGSVNTIGPRACYDEGKRCAETLFFDYNRQHNVNIKVVRIFNTYGPRMMPNDGRVVSNFIMQALKGDDITVYGDGSQTRDFILSEDLCSAIINALNIKEGGEVYQLGSGIETSINTLISIIREIVEPSYTFKVSYKSFREGEIKHNYSDIGKAKKFIGYNPLTNLSEGLKKTWDWFCKE